MPEHAQDGAAPGAGAGESDYGQSLSWDPQAPRIHPVRIVVSWLVAAVSVLFAAAIIPGVTVGSFGMRSRPPS